MSNQTPGRGLTGKRAVVTGGASGIGEAAARRLACEGAQVIVFDKNRQALEQVLDAETEIAGGVQADVSDPEEVAHAYEQVDARMGVQRFTVVDNSDFSPSGLTAHSSLFKIRKLSLPPIFSCEDRDVRSCVRVLAGGQPPPLSGAVLAA